MPSVVNLPSVYDIIKKFGSEFVDALGNSLERKKDASGNLRESIRFEIKIFTEHYRFELKMEDYYKWVDEGRKPGKGVPISPPVLLRWIGQKGLKGVVTTKGLKQISTDIRAAKSAAFLINRKIREKGIKPTYFFTDVIEDGRVIKLKSDLSKALKKDILVEIKQI